MKIELIFSVIIISLLLGCNTHDKSEQNKNFEKTIEHYKKEGNKEKLEAAYYLINNIEDNCSPSSKTFNDYETFFDLLDSLNRNGINTRKKDSFQPIDIVKIKWESVEHYYGSLNSTEYIKDAEIITSEYLIKNIDLAYKAWKENPWCKGTSFIDFCEYILPYKALDEPFENWREFFINKYSWLKDSLKNKYDPVEACIYIEKDVSSWFKYNELFYKVPPIGFSRLMKGKSGVCNHMVTIDVYAARAIGIPIAVDFIPNYGNRRSKHTWLAVKDTGGMFISFNAASSNWLPFGAIECMTTWRNKMTKVFRKTYAVQKNSLFEIASNKNEVPPSLRDNKYIDVTSEYIPVSDITIKIKPNIPAGSHFAYLCVFNNSEWIPVHWGKITNNTVSFKNMGRDIAYLPAFFKNDKLIPIDVPFILSKDGSICKIERNKAEVQKVKFLSKYPWYITQKNDTTNKILKNDVYELFYWENQWKSLGKTTSNDRDSIMNLFGIDFHLEKFLEGTKGQEFIVYKDIPVGALFWLRDLSRGKDERIFTIDENGEQVWW